MDKPPNISTTSIEGRHFDADDLYFSFVRIRDEIMQGSKTAGFSNYLALNAYFLELFSAPFGRSPLNGWHREKELIFSFITLADGKCIKNTPTLCTEYAPKITIDGLCGFCLARKLIICHKELTLAKVGGIGVEKTKLKQILEFFCKRTYGII